MELEEYIKNIGFLNKDYVEKSRTKWNEIGKPPASMGIFEEMVAQISGILENENFLLDKKGLVIMCADNGVVKNGVTQTDTMVTAIMTENFSKGITSVCVMAKAGNIEVFPVDVGVKEDLNPENKKIIRKKIMKGTNDISEGPAMTYKQAMEAIFVGIDLVRELKEKGYKILATGEMGIGNTTTSAALVSVLLDKQPEEVTGLGAGLDEAGFVRKVDAIKRALKINNPSKDDPIELLSKIGGLDIAGLVGVFLGAGYYRVPVLLDGIISGVAALIAIKLCKNVKSFILPSHISNEPAGKLILEEMGMRGFIDASMRLGEGTGSVMGMILLETALEVYNKAAKFSDMEIGAYVRFTR